MKKAFVLGGLMAALAFNTHAVYIQLNGPGGESANIFDGVDLTGWTFFPGGGITAPLGSEIRFTDPARFITITWGAYSDESITRFSLSAKAWGDEATTVSAYQFNGFNRQGQWFNGDAFVYAPAAVLVMGADGDAEQFRIHSLDWLEITEEQTAVPDGGTTAGLLALAMGFIGFAHFRKR